MPRKFVVGVVGVGAFGEFILPHLAAYFDVRIYDAYRDLSPVENLYNVCRMDIEGLKECDVIIFAVPVQTLSGALKEALPHLPEKCIVCDVSSVKVKPAKAMTEILPEGIDIVGTHPLFGPQSGSKGVHGLNVAVCPIRGNRHRMVEHFLRKVLKLNVHVTTPDEHDRQMACVQGITHLMGNALRRISRVEAGMTTRSYELLMESYEIIKDDSPALFAAIAKENPYVESVKNEFFSAVRELEEELKKF
jgi:prephenate dehydrogenase